MSWLRSLASRVGHRGAFLLFLAVLDLCYGYYLLAAPAPQRHLDLLLPWQAWALAWAVAGAACLTGAFTARDWPSFTAAVVIKAAWAAVQCDAWLVQGAALGWISAVIWGCFALTVLVVSSWPDPPRRP